MDLCTSNLAVHLGHAAAAARADGAWRERNPGTRLVARPVGSGGHITPVAAVNENFAAAAGSALRAAIPTGSGDGSRLWPMAMARPRGGAVNSGSVSEVDQRREEAGERALSLEKAALLDQQQRGVHLPEAAVHVLDASRQREHHRGERAGVGLEQADDGPAWEQQEADDNIHHVLAGLDEEHLSAALPPDGNHSDLLQLLLVRMLCYSILPCERCSWSRLRRRGGLRRRRLRVRLRCHGAMISVGVAHDRPVLLQRRAS